MVLKAEEDTIGYYIGSPITRESLTAKPAAAKAPKAAAAEAAPAPKEG